MSFNFFRSKPLHPADAQAFTEKLVASSPSISTHVPTANLVANESLAPPPEPITIACMVTHGMGQQVPFATVGQLTEAFVKGREPSSVKANRVALTDKADLISRMELIYPAKDGLPQTTVHVYEGYWAPLTEGKIGFFATILFLLSGAWEGLKSSLRPLSGRPRFERWIFGRLMQLPIKPGTALYLLLTVFVLAVALGIFYLCETRLHAAYNALKPLENTTLSNALARIWSHFTRQVDSLWHILKARHLLLFLYDTCKFLAVPIYLALAAVYILFLRYAVIEYVGDVAIYVSAYKVSSYEEVRQAIQKVVFDVGRQIFQATNGGMGAGYLYDKVIFVGHSLGSVITYDLLNALIVWDVFSNQTKYQVSARTSEVITFGSPLDKTAFLFRTQISPDHHYREALAALQQPIILDYRMRPFKWTNLYSRADVISGSLAYYDLPTDCDPAAYPGYNHTRRVDNQPDPRAWIPIIAHIQYWNGETLRHLLQSAIRRCHQTQTVP